MRSVSSRYVVSSGLRRRAKLHIEQPGTAAEGEPRRVKAHADGIAGQWPGLGGLFAERLEHFGRRPRPAAGQHRAALDEIEQSELNHVDRHTLVQHVLE